MILILYGLSWVSYAVKYSNDKQVILRNYGGITTYDCTGGVTPPNGQGYIRIHPTSYVLPFEGMSYTIEYGAGPIIATGRVSLSGKLSQTNIQYSNNPVCSLL